MRRTMGTAAFILPLVALALGPWFGVGSVTAQVVASSHWFAPKFSGPPERVEPKTTRGNTQCNCRTVDVSLKNDVRDTEVMTGDARVVNFNVTYVSADYGDRDVDVDQEAEAISGDAIAGQVIAVDARGPGCVNVRVHADNHVEDAEVSTGDATAINRSIVLLDPGVSRGDLDIDIEQDAEAHSGDAVAGQIIDIIGGSRVGRCGGAVDLKAVNEVLHTYVETGRALSRNFSEIRTCAAAGCEAELRALLGSGANLEVCSGSECREADESELSVAAARPEAEGETDDSLASPCEAPSINTPGKRDADASEPAPTATPQSESAPSSPAPSTSPQTSPSPCPTPSPSSESAWWEFFVRRSDDSRGPAA